MFTLNLILKVSTLIKLDCLSNLICLNTFFTKDFHFHYVTRMNNVLNPRNPQASIECYRRALAVSPNNAEILLNLARVLFNLSYLDDALFLTRRSLEVQPHDQIAWQQHFQVSVLLHLCL